MNEEALNPGSLINLLRQILQRAGIPAEASTSHSLRRGVAAWASANGWDIQALMTYVGWKDQLTSRAALGEVQYQTPGCSGCLLPLLMYGEPPSPSDRPHA